MSPDLVVALSWLAASVVVLLSLSCLFLYEDRRGDRVVLVKARSVLDRFALTVKQTIQYVYIHLVRWFVRLVLQHGAYRLLHSVVRKLTALEERTDKRVRSKRSGVEGGDARDRTPNHLDEIAAHKETTSLSDDERRRLRDR